MVCDFVAAKIAINQPICSWYEYEYDGCTTIVDSVSVNEHYVAVPNAIVVQWRTTNSPSTTGAL